MSVPLHTALTLSFIQLFVAVDVLGILPIYAGIVENVVAEKQRRLVRDCLVTAFLVGIVFIFMGTAVLRLMGITLGDFQIAGGLILALIGVLDLVGDEKRLNKPPEMIGVVPLGIPLIVGPAVISALLLLSGRIGWFPTLASFVVNLVIVGLAFRHAPTVTRFFGKNGMRAISKVMMLFLIGIGIRMIRLGIIASFMPPPSS